MSENFNIELDSGFIKNFFELGDMPAPEEVTLEDLNKVIEKIKGKLNEAASLNSVSVNSDTTAPMPSSVSAPANPSGASKPIKSVLVVDDLGIVTIQLESILKKLGFDVVVSRELFDAIEKYKTQDFGYAIVDLFIPTEREGFILIDEIKKLALLCKLNTRIIVMSASNKKEHKENCLNRGANHYVEKAQGWQKRIAEICVGEDG